jgi:fatty-acyl-CoA synthase
MNIIRLFLALSKSGLLSISSITKLLRAIFKQGLNLMTLLDFAASKYGENVALIDDTDELTYSDLLKDSIKLSTFLNEQYNVRPKQKIGILCRNHGSLAKSIFALSRLGVNIYLINAEVGKLQFDQLIKKQPFDFFIYDAHFSLMVKEANIKQKLCITEIIEILNHSNLVSQPTRRTSSSNIILLTSGTTGTPKEVIHKPSLFNYLNPFLGMVQRLKIVQYKNGFIATPLYHGYGIAILFLFITLGKKVVLSEKFNAKKACELIQKHQVEIVTVVPLMIHKMLKENVAYLSSLRCIASGGSVLNPNLVEEVKGTLGKVLYNLYGTSETGLNIIATPDDLTYSTCTLGKGIRGLKLKIVNHLQENAQRGTIGQLWVKSKGSMVNPNNNWISTGDLAYQDANGFYFLAGRQDDMIVSAGENVYPIHIENILLEHPFIEDVAVIGIHDEQFGQRLQAFIQAKQGAEITQQVLFEWLQSKVARYEMPKEITFIDSIPYTPLGKKNKKQLRAI